MKGFIKVSSITSGLNAKALQQVLAVDKIDAVLDVKSLDECDRLNLGLESSTQTLLICSAISNSPNEVLEDFETVLALMVEASR
jgi:hypothetical protein